MSLDQTEIKKLLEGVELEEGAIITLASLIEKRVGEKLQEVATAKDAEITGLKERLTEVIKKAEEYGQYCSNETRAEVSALAEEYGKSVQEELVGRLNEYSKYAINEFITEQKEQFVQLDEFNRMKHVFETVKHSFETNGFQIDTSKELTEAKTEIANAKESFNSLYTQLQETQKELATAQQAIIFNEMTANLTDTQKERIHDLSENIKFNGLDEFHSAMKFMVETVTKDKGSKETPAAPTLTESRESVEQKNAKNLVEQVLKIL